MKRDETGSIVASLVLLAVLCLGIYQGFWSLSSVLSLVPYFLLVAIIGILGWGFRQRIDGLFKTGLQTEIDSLEGEVKGGKVRIGEKGSDRSYGIHATGKSEIKNVDKVKVVTEGQPGTGVLIEDAAKIEKLGEVEVKHEKRGFWSRVSDLISSLCGD